MTNDRHPGGRRRVLLAAGMCVLAGCSGGGGGAEKAAPMTTASSVAVTTAPAALPATTAPSPVPIDAPFASDTRCADPATSSRAAFDPRGGLYPAYLYGVNATRPAVAFDVVQVLVGDDATRAFLAANPSSAAGPPGGSWLVNAYEHTDEAPLASAVAVRLSGYGESPVLIPGTLDVLLRDQNVGRSSVFWLTFRDGTVTELCQELRYWSNGAVTEDPTYYETPPGSLPACPGAGASSRNDFDPQGGRYMVYLFGVDTTRRTVAFDVVQMLSGEEAIRVWKQHPEEHPDDPDGPPNDYFIINAFEHTDEAVVAGDVRVLLLHPTGRVVAADFADIVTHRRAGRHPGYGLYWLTFSGGRVTEICQQFTP